MAFFALPGAQSDNGVYRIIVSAGFFTGSGTGFKVADPGYIITNHHVIDRAEETVVAYIDEYDQKQVIEADVVWFDTDKDLALLRTRTPVSGRVAALADIRPEDIEKSSSVTAVGFPGAADRVANSLASGSWDTEALARSTLDATVSSGTVQRVVSTVQRVVIQHSANINPGNSGGPLFDACNRVIGVNTFTANPGLNAGDLEFAVHTQEVLSGLQEALRRAPRNETFSPRTRSGACRGGFDNREIGAISLTLALGIGSGLAGFMAMARQGNTGGAIEVPSIGEIPVGHDPAGTVDTQLRAGLPDQMLFLTARATGEVISRIPISSLDSEKGLVLGRPSGGGDIEVGDPSISRRHAVIRRNGNSVSIHDLGSTNGTEVDGTKLSKTRGMPLADGSRIRLGSIEIDVSIRAQSGPGRTHAAEVGAILLSGFDEKGRAIQHTVMSRGQLANKGQLKAISTVGRDRSNTLQLEANSVSRRHALIGVDEYGTLCVVDLGSSNGTCVDGKRIGKQPVPIGHAKTVSFGELVLAISLLTN